MLQKLRPAISIALLGAAITFMFGAWSVAAVCLIVGAIVGLNAGQHSTQRAASDIGREAIQPGLVASFIVVLGGVLYQFVLQPITGNPISSTLFLKIGENSPALDSITALVISAMAGLIMGPLTAYFTASTYGYPEKQRRTRLLIALGGFLLLFPFYEQITIMNWMAALISVQIYILLALGLNIVVGYAGLLDLGYAAFFAIGAYTTGLLSSGQLNIHWNFWLIIWIAAAVAAIAGLALGTPTLPLRGDYLAIVTLGFGEIVPVVFRNLIQVTLREPFTGLCFLGCDPAVEKRMATCFYACTGPLNLTSGERGINPLGRPVIPFTDPSLFGANYLPWYFLVLVLIVFSIFLIGRMRDSRLGRAWMAIREDELAASQMGIDPVKTKLMAFAMGATFSGFGGAFYGAYISGIFPSVFDFSVSVIILCMVILGGLGNMTGVIVGGILIIGTDKLFLPRIAELLKAFMNTSVLPNVSNLALKDFLSTSVDPLQMRQAIFGIVLVTMMLVRPEGLIPSAERKAELHAAEAEPIEEAEAETGA